uniref:Uncharacterized protein n=1 Tax=Stereomyxa ramosa TaxID=1078864 RepID=A0A7S2EZ75_9EUKA|mmetsp:Transcript_204/g.237  ORF Transcript_204/g.237 Transcript_204/m.237 type:complete len:202 (+) Transcript_204:248-853(+)
MIDAQQYFDYQNFENFFGDMDFELVQLDVTDTYNEYEVSKTIDKIGKEICFAVAAQLSIVGFGNKKYGTVTFEDKKIEIKDFFDKNGIFYMSKMNDTLEPGDLTPRRLIRFYRFAIKKYIEVTNVYPYLFKKYCPNRDISLKNRIFNGYEHMIEPDEEEVAIVLIRTYENLDKRLNTNIRSRIERVLIARGFNFEFLQSIK